MDPVQDDEGHAADHDHEAQQQEGSGLDRRTISHSVFTLSDFKEELNNLSNMRIHFLATVR